MVGLQHLAEGGRGVARARDVEDDGAGHLPAERLERGAAVRHAADAVSAPFEVVAKPRSDSAAPD